MSLAVVTLKKGEGRLLKSGGMWVFDNEIASIMGSFVNGDIAVLNTVMPNAVQPTVTLDTDTASKLTKKVLEAYLNVLKDGGATYTASETDIYVSSQLNMVNNDMKKIFSIETEPATDDILAAQSAEDRQTLYNDTMKFFEQLYGESTDTSAQQESTDETSYDEESYD